MNVEGRTQHGNTIKMAPGWNQFAGFAKVAWQPLQHSTMAEAVVTVPAGIEKALQVRRAVLGAVPSGGRVFHRE